MAFPVRRAQTVNNVAHNKISMLNLFDVSQITTPKHIFYLTFCPNQRHTRSHQGLGCHGYTCHHVNLFCHVAWCSKKVKGKHNRRRYQEKELFRETLNNLLYTHSQKLLCNVLCDCASIEVTTVFCLFIYYLFFTLCCYNCHVSLLIDQ